jgi:hypothetical protein
MAWYDFLLNDAGTGLSSDTTKLLGAGIGALGSAYASNQAAANQQGIANQNLAAGQAAADAAAFRPVGVTTRFGKSGFTYDDQGRLTGAGYQVAPDVAAQREALMGLAGGSLSQAQSAQGFAPQLQGYAQGLFGLGQQFLPTSSSYSASPEAQAYSNQLRTMAGQVMPSSYDTTAAAQQYMQQQQGLLAPQREQQLAGIRNQLQQTGRSGLATGATAAGGRAATNPEMAAYYNSIAQQDTTLGANAQQIARGNLQQDITLGQQLGGTALQTQQAAEEIARQRMLSNLQTGTGLFGTGAGLIGQGYGLQTQALSPWTSYLGGAQTLEGLGQNALTQGSALGSSLAAAGANQGASLLKSGLYAADSNQTAATAQTATTAAQIKALQQLQDPIARLIGNLGGSSGTNMTQKQYAMLSGY